MRGVEFAMSPMSSASSATSSSARGWSARTNNDATISIAIAARPRVTSVRETRGGPPRGHLLHLEELDERAGTGQQARLLEDGLLFERLEVEILRERVDQILVGHRGRQLRVRNGGAGGAALDHRRQHRLDLRPALANGRPLRGGRRRLVEDVDRRAAIAPLVVLAVDAEAIEAAQDD